MRSFSDSYRAAGVNIEAGYEGVKLMKEHVARTMIPGVVSDLGVWDFMGSQNNWTSHVETILPGVEETIREMTAE